MNSPALDAVHEQDTRPPLTMGEIAGYYATLGIPVFPANRDKTPKTTHGLHDASRDGLAIAKWWGRWPDANIAGATGYRSDVLDIDPAAMAWHDEHEDELNRPGTIRVRTPRGGWHYHYAPTGHGNGARIGGIDGLDWRGTGGYTLMPPSVTDAGSYRWADGEPPAAAWLTLPEPPDIVLGLLRQKTRSAAVTAPDASIPAGSRNDTLASLGGTLRRRGLDQEAIRAALDGINRTSCDPPLPDAEVAAIAASVSRYEPVIEREYPDELPDAPAEDRGRQSLGSLTVADLDHGAPPPQLAEPFISPTGITVLYGKGGTGKGITAAHLITLLLTEGHRPYILDYEGHPEEWGYRLHGLGLPDEDKRRVAYRWPYGPEWTAHRGPLIEVADLVRKDAEAFGATVVVIDSYTVATSTGDTMGGAAAAQEFATACALIGLPVLVLAHVRGDGPKFPEKPFGSVFVHNLARLTWAVEALDANEADPENPFAPKVVRLEFRNMKRNRGGKFPPQFLTFGFYPDHTITVEAERPVKPKLADLIAAVLDAPMTIPDIVKAITEDTGEKPHPEAVRKTLHGNPARFVEDTGKRPRKWSRR